MEQTTNKKKNSIEELLNQTDIELTAYWPKLASLIMAFEGLYWSESGVKSRDLLKSGKVKAFEYLNEVRAVFNPPLTIETKSVTKNVKQKQRFLNYRRLLKLAPDLEPMLLSGKEVTGKSSVTGYMDFNLELISSNKRGYYIILSQHNKQNGNFIPDPSMVIRLSMKHEFIEALTFQNSITYNEVFDNYLNPKFEDPKEKKAQNTYLSVWLRNLIKQKHYIEFEEEEEFEPIQESDNLIDETIYDELINVEVSEPNEKLISVIGQVENIDYPKATERAAELVNTEKSLDYLIRAVNRQSISSLNELYRINYQKLMRLIPNLDKESLIINKSGFIKEEKDGVKLKYEFLEPISAIVYKVSIQEIGTEKNQIIAINNVTRKAWQLNSDNNLDDKLKLNEELGSWLRKMLKYDFKKSEEEFNLLNWDDEVNTKIPNFEVGKVKLVEAHKKVGLDQNDIDYLNNEKRGLTITPLNKEKKGRKQSFRVSKTGKLYR